MGRKLYRPKPLEKVEVIWLDALYDGDSDCKPEAFDPALASLINIGYFVRMTVDAVVLVSCIQPSNGSTRWFVTIPRVNVKEIRPVAAAEGTA